MFRVLRDREQAGGVDDEAAEPDKPAPRRRCPEGGAEPGEPECPREPGPVEGHEDEPRHATEDQGGEMAHGDTMDGRAREREVGIAMGDAAQDVRCGWGAVWSAGPEGSRLRLCETKASPSGV